MLKKLSGFLLVGLLILISVIIVYYFQKPGLTPVYEVDAPIEGLLMESVDNSKQDDTLVPILDPTTNLYGYQTPAGQTIITPQFSRAFKFSKYGIADVYMEASREWLKIDKSGKSIVISYFFDNGPDYYVNGLSRFVKNNQIGFINRQGHPVIPATYDWAGIFTYNYPITVVAKGCQKVKLDPYDEMRGGKWGAIDNHGKVIIPLVYDAITFTDTEQVKEGKSGILTFIQGDKKYQLFHTRWGKYILIQVV
jgi:hypothetical protein